MIGPVTPEYLRAWRAKRNLTRTAAANMLCLTRQSWSKWELHGIWKPYAYIVGLALWAIDAQDKIKVLMVKLQDHKNRGIYMGFDDTISDLKKIEKGE